MTVSGQTGLNAEGLHLSKCEQGLSSRQRATASQTLQHCIKS
uniref:Uncharacterized protein n=1 Tax=Anguilla anguilla TaxID=7936 RepID=A0A0E9PRA0_ANGAN